MRQLSLDASVHPDAVEPVDLDEAEELVEDATPEGGATPDCGTQAGSTGGCSFASGLVSDAEAADDPGIPATEQPQPTEAGPLDAHALATALSELADENMSHGLPSHEQANAGAAIRNFSASPDPRCHSNYEHSRGVDGFSEAAAVEGTNVAHQIISPQVDYLGEAAEQTSLVPYWHDPAPGIQANAEQLALVHYHAAWNMHAAEQQALQQQSMAQHAMPGDWTSHFDPSSGRVYYHNAKLGITQWETPGSDFAQLDAPEAVYKEAQVTCTCTVSQLRQAGACAFMGILAISTAVACYFIIESVS